MTLISLKDITNCDDYYIDDKTLQIWSFKQKKYENGKLLKPNIRKDGYIQYSFSVNGKVKQIFYHHIIVKMFIKPNYDSNIEEIDHMDHDRTNNSIENLKVVSCSENQRNQFSKNGKKFNFVDDIGTYLVINEEAGIYYSLDLDKFFMFIGHTNFFKELHECIYNGYLCIRYCFNKKYHTFCTTKFKRNLNKK